MFSVKAPRYATIRKVLADAGPSIELFVKSGLAELGDKLGPILWQFAPTKRFEAEDLDAFLKLLPREIGGRRARHVLEPRHESFLNAEFVDLARRYGSAIVFTDSEDYPAIGDVTSDFVYARLVRSQSSIKTGYSTVALEAWAKSPTCWPEAASRRSFRVWEQDGRNRVRATCSCFLSTARKSAHRLPHKRCCHDCDGVITSL